jgi:hypothetical protein
MIGRMALGDERRPLMMRLRSRWELLHEIGALLAVCAFALVVALLLLMALGLGVRDLSTVVGMPLPYVADDPDRIEWGGVAELVGYGLAGALALYALGRRVLPATAGRHLGRWIGHPRHDPSRD